MYMLCGYSQKRRERESRNLLFFSPLNPETVSNERDSDAEEADLHELYLPAIYYWGGTTQKVTKKHPPTPKKKKRSEFVNVQSVIFTYVFWTGRGKKEIL